MNANQAATYLQCSGSQVKTLMTKGAALPISKKVVKLKGTASGKHVEISEAQLDEYIARFEAEEPGRHPSVGVCRILLTEARHHCAICLESHPLQFHHLIDWAVLKHHDPDHMLAICGSCHTKCTKGLIDSESQRIYKDKLATKAPDPARSLKEAKDRKVIEEIFATFPSQWIELFLEEAKSDKFWYDLPIHKDGLTIAVNSPVFYLHDAELWQLLKDFFNYWDNATLRASVLYHGNCTGVAYLDPGVHDNPILHSAHEQVRKLFQETRRTLALIQAHIRERYPEIDLDELGRQASFNAHKRMTELREEMKLGAKNKRKR